MSPLLATQFWVRIEEVLPPPVREVGGKIRRRIRRYIRKEDEWIVKGILFYPDIIKRISLTGILRIPFTIDKNLIGKFFIKNKLELPIKGNIIKFIKLSLITKGILTKSETKELSLKGEKTYRKLFEILFEDD